MAAAASTKPAAEDDTRDEFDSEAEDGPDYFLCVVACLPVRSPDGGAADTAGAGVCWMPSHAVVSCVHRPTGDDSRAGSDEDEDDEVMSVSVNCGINVAYKAVALRELQMLADRMGAHQMPGTDEGVASTGFQVCCRDTHVRTLAWIQREEEEGVGVHLNFGDRLARLPVFDLRAPALVSEAMHT